MVLEPVIPPGVPCGDGASQVTAALGALDDAKTSIDTLWLDIEIESWGDDTAANQAFIQDLIDAVPRKQTVGIYTSTHSWEPIAGNWTGPADQGLALWCVASPSARVEVPRKGTRTTTRTRPSTTSRPSAAGRPPT